MTLTLLANAPVQLSSAQITPNHRQLPRQRSVSITHSSNHSFASLTPLNNGLLASSSHQPSIHHFSSTLDSHKADCDIDRSTAAAASISTAHSSLDSATHPAATTALSSSPSLQNHHQQQQHRPSTSSSCSNASHLREWMTTSSAEAPTSMSASPASQSSTSVTCLQLPSASTLPPPSSSLPLVTVSATTAAATTAVHTSTTCHPSSSDHTDISSNSTVQNTPIHTSSTKSLTSPLLNTTTSLPSSLSSPSEPSLPVNMPSETRSWMTREIVPAATPMPLHDLHEGPLVTSMTHKKRPSWSMSVDYPSHRPTHSRQLSSDKPGQPRSHPLLPHTPDQAPYPSPHHHHHSSYTQPLNQHPHVSPSDMVESQQPPPSKKRPISRRPWTNAEQESLYIAVEKYKLFGQWQQVQVSMKLDRSAQEIEDEYMRIYGELPDSEEGEDELLLCSPSTRTERAFGHASSHHPQQHSSSIPSSASSPSSARSSFSFASAAGTTSSAMSLMARHEQMFPPIQYESIFEQDEEDDEEHPGGSEMDVDHKSNNGPSNRSNHHDGAPTSSSSARAQAHGHRGSISSSPTRMRRPSTHLPTHTKSASSVSGLGDLSHHHHHHHHHHHQRTASESLGGSTGSSNRPTRMVRVWTPEQSERLKNLIELYFPGAYRINWVWVAEQMGNSFTRKQCKNKWEIMRRRMGTEEEISLLKKGYEEFGPSWGEIQEKYLPERSRGGIEIMWELLESREAGQNQPPPPPPQLLPTMTQLKQSALPVDEQYHLAPSSQPPHSGRSSSSVTTGGGAAAAAAAGGGTTLNRKQRASGLSIATNSISQHGQSSSPPPSSSKGQHSTSNHTPLTSFSAGGLATSDIEAMEISSPPLPLVSPHPSISAPVSSSTTMTAAEGEGDRDRAGGGDAYGGRTGWRHERTTTGSSSIGMSVDSGSGGGSPFLQQQQQQQHQSVRSHEEGDYYHHELESSEDRRAVESTTGVSGGVVTGGGGSDRSAPMIWTEPLTRRLEQAIQEHFPNGEKVNWAKISALMGQNPAVSRDQCKRRWYLISQNQFYQRRHNEMHGGGGLAMGGSSQASPQGFSRGAVGGGGDSAGSLSSSSLMMMVEMETAEHEGPGPVHPYYGQQGGQYLTQHPPSTLPPHHSHARHHQQASPQDGWSE